MNDSVEIWRPVKDYEDLYEVSNLGRVRIKKNCKIRKTVYNKNTNYEMCMLRKNGKYKNCYVHRLVAEVFIANPNNLPEIDHRDHNRQNNFVGNLAWSDKHNNLLCRGKYYHYKNRPVKQVEVETGAVVAVYDDYIHAGFSLGVRPCRVAQILDESDKKHLSMYGYVFKFV